MSFFDFNFSLPFWHHSTVFQPLQEAVDESWPNRFRSAVGLHSELSVSGLRRPIPGQPLCQKLLLLGSVPLSGLCSTHLSRELARYRGVSPHPAVQALDRKSTRLNSSH